MPKVSVVVPAYNEGKNIYRNILEFMETFARLQLDYELIIVDDGSGDDTYQQASKALSERVKVFTYPENRGKGYALKYGVAHATGELVTFLDADMDIHPEQTSVLLEYIEGNDIVIGCKRHPLSRVKYPLTRRFLSACYHLMVRLLFRLRLNDTQTGIKLFRREALAAALPKVTVNGYAFDLDLLVNANNMGFRIAEAPIVLDYQFNGSGINLMTIWQIFKDTMTIFYREKITRYYRPNDTPPRTDSEAPKMGSSPNDS
ncbi:MAG: glycosyltransferase [Candidatus Hydrothermarchaeota archaeon]